MAIESARVAGIQPTGGSMLGSALGSMLNMMVQDRYRREAVLDTEVRRQIQDIYGGDVAAFAQANPELYQQWAKTFNLPEQAGPITPQGQYILDQQEALRMLKAGQNPWDLIKGPSGSTPQPTPTPQPSPTPTPPVRPIKDETIPTPPSPTPTPPPQPDKTHDRSVDDMVGKVLGQLKPGDYAKVQYDYNGVPVDFTIDTNRLASDALATLIMSTDGLKGRYAPDGKPDVSRFIQEMGGSPEGAEFLSQFTSRVIDVISNQAKQTNPNVPYTPRTPGQDYLSHSYVPGAQPQSPPATPYQHEPISPEQAKQIGFGSTGLPQDNLPTYQRPIPTNTQGGQPLSYAVGPSPWDAKNFETRASNYPQTSNYSKEALQQMGAAAEQGRTLQEQFTMELARAKGMLAQNAAEATGTGRMGEFRKEDTKPPAPATQGMGDFRRKAEGKLEAQPAPTPSPIDPEKARETQQKAQEVITKTTVLAQSTKILPEDAKSFATSVKDLATRVAADVPPPTKQVVQEAKKGANEVIRKTLVQDPYRGRNLFLLNAQSLMEESGSPFRTFMEALLPNTHITQAQLRLAKAEADRQEALAKVLLDPDVIKAMKEKAITEAQQMAKELELKERQVRVAEFAASTNAISTALQMYFQHRMASTLGAMGNTEVYSNVLKAIGSMGTTFDKLPNDLKEVVKANIMKMFTTIGGFDTAEKTGLFGLGGWSASESAASKKMQELAKMAEELARAQKQPNPLAPYSTLPFPGGIQNPFLSFQGGKEEQPGEKTKSFLETLNRYMQLYSGGSSNATK